MGTFPGKSFCSGSCSTWGIFLPGVSRARGFLHLGLDVFRVHAVEITHAWRQKLRLTRPNIDRLANISTSISQLFVLGGLVELVVSVITELPPPEHCKLPILLYPMSMLESLLS